MPIQDSLNFSLDVFGLELRQNALEVLETLAVQVVTWGEVRRGQVI